MSDLKVGDRLVCTKGYSYFKVGTLFNITNIIDKNAWVAETGGESYVGHRVSSGIYMHIGNVICEFEVLPPEKFEVPSRGSKLTAYMLLDGCKAIVCEVSDDEKDFNKFDSIDRVVITQIQVIESESRQVFVDYEGYFHNAAQPINLDGTVMSGDDYKKLKNI